MSTRLSPCALPLLLALFVTSGCGGDDTAGNGGMQMSDMAAGGDASMALRDMGQGGDVGVQGPDAAGGGGDGDMRGGGPDGAMVLDVGGDMGAGVDMVVDMGPPSACSGKQVQGVVYQDLNNDALSLYKNNKPFVADAPFATHEVRLFGSNTPIATCR